MFKFSQDELIASKQQEKADKLLEDLGKEYKFEYSQLIDNLFILANVESFQSIINMVKLWTADNQKLQLLVLSYDHILLHAIDDLQIQINSLNMSKETMTIPYISLSFPPDYDNPHGPDFQHVFLFFVTKYKEFKVAEECIAYYVDKFDRIGEFV